MLHVQVGHQVSLPQYPSTPIRLGAPRYEMEQPYFFDTVLPFELRSAPYLFDQFSYMFEWIIKNKLGIPNVIHILDDFFFVTRSDCLTALCKILCLFIELNIPVGKTFAPTTSLEFMGILLDSTRMEARLPLDKLTHVKQAVQQLLHHKSATLKELQSLIAPYSLPAGLLPWAGLFCQE